MELLLPLLKKGATIGNFKSVEAGTAVKSLNDALTNAGLAVGAVLVVVAAIKMIIALAGEDSRSRTESTILMSVGILFISITQVIKALGVDNINGSTSVNTVAGNVITVIASMLTWAGGLLAVFAIFTLAVSIAQENSDGFVNGTKLIGVSAGLLSVGAVANGIKGLLLQKSTNGNAYVNVIVNFLANAATYVGGGLAVVGVFKLILSIREENSKERDTAIKFLMAGIALISIRAILRGMGL